MKRKKIDVKKIIKKKIEINNNCIQKTMNDRDRFRIFGNVNGPSKQEQIKQIYIKKNYVDYDVVICIPSFERYEKIKRLIGQFYLQSTIYTFKIILLNDGSIDKRYDDLINEFSDIIYLKNDKPNGKKLHWYCYSQMWKYIKNIQCHIVLQMDDDFILCDNFLNTIINLFFEKKITNPEIMAIAPHLWSVKEHSEYEEWWDNNWCNNFYNNKIFIDGIAAIDYEVIKYMNYEMKMVNLNKLKPGSSAFAWSQIGEAIKAMKCKVFKTSNSLVYHDGNDSKLHKEHRSNKNKLYTQKYIGNL